MTNVFKVDGLNKLGQKIPATGKTVGLYNFSVGDLPHKAPAGTLIGACSEISGEGKYKIDLTVDARATLVVDGKCVPGMIGFQARGDKAFADWADTSAFQDASVTPLKTTFATYINDTFTAANGTNLNGKATDTGEIWTVETGTGVIQNNALTVTAGPLKAHLESGIADIDFSVTVRATTGSGWQPGIIFRRQDANNYLACDIQDTGDVIRYYRVVAGVPQGILTAAYTIQNNITYTLKVVAKGSSINCTVTDGSTSALIATATTTFQTQTRHGLITLGTVPVFDDLLIQDS